MGPCPEQCFAQGILAQVAAAGLCAPKRPERGWRHRNSEVSWGALVAQWGLFSSLGGGVICAAAVRHALLEIFLLVYP
jgi:hypothetical protein